MSVLFDEIDPYETGFLDVGDGHQIYWQTSGNPAGKPAVAFHGGPGGRMTPWYQRMFDPQRYRIIQFDQRSSGRSTPSACDYETDMSTNTTLHLLSDIEKLRVALGVDRWLVMGASWGSALALTYAQRHRTVVSELILCGVAAQTQAEVDWITRGLGRFFPEAFDRFISAVPKEDQDKDLSTIYNRLLEDPDSSIREKAAKAWCDWEEAIIQLGAEFKPVAKFADPRLRYGFARTVTHYWSNGGWLVDREILDNMHLIADIPGAMVHGKLDMQGPLTTPWELSKRWPAATLHAIPGAGHCDGELLDAALVTATNRFAPPKAEL